MEDKKQPIIIKKVVAGHGHHGGSWKVAFADFATAMMAFFMVLWLVGQTDAKKRGGIAEYFQNPSMVRGNSEAPTGSIGPGGAGMSLISFGTSIEVRKEDPTVVKKIRDGGMAYVSYDKIREQRRMETLLQELKSEIGSNSAMEALSDQVLLELTPNGLRIQIIEQANRPMFDPGSANLRNHTEQVLHSFAKTINRVSNKISISGHTDATPMSKGRGSYTNWELSADRANAARRALIAGGMKKEKIGRVVGLASTVLLDKENPGSAINRRISIVVLKREVSDLSKLDEETQAIPKQLLQNAKILEVVKDNKPAPVASDTLELKTNTRVKKPEPSSLRELDQLMQGSSMEMKGIDKKEKGSKSTRKKPYRKAPRMYDQQIIIRDRQGAKSFIDLPQIVNPSLIPKVKQDNNSESK